MQISVLVTLPVREASVSRLVASKSYGTWVSQVSVEQLSESTLERSEFHRSFDVEELARLQPKS